MSQLGEYSVVVDYYVIYSPANNKFRSIVEIQYKGQNHKEFKKFSKETDDLKMAALEFSKYCLEELYEVSKHVGIQGVKFVIHYRNNKVFNAIVDKKNMWIDQIKNLLIVDESLVFKKIERNISRR